MRTLLLAVTLGTLVQTGGQPAIEHLVFNIEGGGEMPYALSIPANYDETDPPPLVLALHPGGKQSSYYGSLNMRRIFEPALRDWGAIIVAPDAPIRRWTDDTADRAVMDVLKQVIDNYAVDRSRILVTGFSMGGRGTWFFATQHPDFFTGAIPIAGSPGDDDVTAVADMPVHIIHSRADEVVPFGPAEEAARALEQGGHVTAFTALENVSHYSMGGYIPALKEAGDWMLDQWNNR